MNIVSMDLQPSTIEIGMLVKLYNEVYIIASVQRIDHRGDHVAEISLINVLTGNPWSYSMDVLSDWRQRIRAVITDHDGRVLAPTIELRRRS